MTNNFKRSIGKGGFVTVYHGQMTEGTKVAVKMLSLQLVKSLSHTCQGSREFQNEVQLLIRVHHRNLVPSIGYCHEGGNMALIYEHMAQGNLGIQLSGLEYLHNGCKGPIIHRDMKTANILLNERLEAKIGYFGLSKVFSDEFTHVSTAVKGTFGYLNPKCADQRRSLIDWAISMVAGGAIKDTIDPKLEGNYDLNSVQKAVEIARACTLARSIERPLMRDVVVELKECLGIEKALESGGCLYSGPIETSSVILFHQAFSRNQDPLVFSAREEERFSVFSAL